MNKQQWIYRILLFELLIIGFFVISSTKVTALESEPKILFVGASNTNEVQWENGSYFTKLQDLGEPWLNSSMINSSNDGWGVRNYYLEEELVNERITKYNPNYIVLSLGGNDLLRFLSTEDYNIQLNWLLDEIIDNDVNRQIQMIFVANIYWVDINIDVIGFVEDRYFEYQGIIENVTIARNLILLDYYSVTLNHTEFFVNDMIHLNEEGHKAIANEVNRIAAPIILADNKNFYEIPHTNPDAQKTDPETISSAEYSGVKNEESPFLLPISIIIIPIISYHMRKKKQCEMKLEE